MKTEEEITKGLDICNKGVCGVECPYYGDGPNLCRDNMGKDARILIAQIRNENRALRTELEVNRISVKKEETDGPDQTAKQDNGKLDPTLVPTELIWAVAKVRQVGTMKYHNDPDNWKKVEKERFRAAAYRHFLKYIKDPAVLDEESGLPNLWHCCCNLSFLCAMEKYDVE